MDGVRVVKVGGWMRGWIMVGLGFSSFGKIEILVSN